MRATTVKAVALRRVALPVRARGPVHGLLAAGMLSTLVQCGRTPPGDLGDRCSPLGIPRLVCRGVCAGDAVVLAPEPPRILLALDRSCSMLDHWDDAIDALIAVLSMRPHDASWGLSVFPDRELDACMQGDLLMPIAEDAADRMGAFLWDALDPMHPAHPGDPCTTNITGAIVQAAGDPAFADRVGGKAMLLLTDGWDNCGGHDAAEGAEELLRRLHDEHGVSTYVISFRSQVSPTRLTALARAGGTARAQSPAYYLAEGEDLAGIVDGIVDELRCEFAVDVPEHGVDRLEVVIEGEAVPEHAEDGWTYDPASRRLRVHGPACDRLAAGDGTLELRMNCE